MKKSKYEVSISYERAVVVSSVLDSDAHRSRKMATLDSWEKSRFREGLDERAPRGLGAGKAEPAAPGTRHRHRQRHMNRHTSIAEASSRTMPRTVSTWATAAASAASGAPAATARALA